MWHIKKKKEKIRNTSGGPCSVFPLIQGVPGLRKVEDPCFRLWEEIWQYAASTQHFFTFMLNCFVIYTYPKEHLQQERRTQTTHDDTDWDLILQPVQIYWGEPYMVHDVWISYCLTVFNYNNWWNFKDYIQGKWNEYFSFCRFLHVRPSRAIKM